MSCESSERFHDSKNMSAVMSDVSYMQHSTILCPSSDSGVCCMSKTFVSETSLPCQSLDVQSRNQSLGYYSIDGCQKQFNSLKLTSPTTETAKNQGHAVPVEEIALSTELFYELYSQDEDGDTKLHLAIISMDAEAAAWMIAATAMCRPTPLNLQNDRFRQTPLHLAVITNQPRIVRMLVICNALLDIRDRNGNTPLHLACSKGMLDCIKAMTIPVSDEEYCELDRYCEMVRLPIIEPPTFLSPNLNCLDYDGCSYLHLVQRLNPPCRIEVFNFLLTCGANPNIQDGKSGQSVLHLAVKRRDLEFVRYLCKCHGVDLNLMNYAQQTALDIAYHLKYDDVFLQLQQCGAAHSEFFYNRSANDSSNEDSEIEEYDDIVIGGQPVH